MDTLPMFYFQVKIAARELEKVIAGLTMRVANHPDEVDFDPSYSNLDICT